MKKNIRSIVATLALGFISFNASAQTIVTIHLRRDYPIQRYVR